MSLTLGFANGSWIFTMQPFDVECKDSPDRNQPNNCRVYRAEKFHQWVFFQYFDT